MAKKTRILIADDHPVIVEGIKNILETEAGIEKEVFILLADGLSIKKIAERLYISPKTVESHKYNIMDKLHVDITNREAYHANNFKSYHRSTV